jgi:long-chain acyl-CoA synthetase
MPYRNLVELQHRQAERLGPHPALRYKQHGLYHDLSWERYWSDTQACGAALLEAGIQPGDRVGVLSENRVEWLIADMGLLAAAAVCVPPHAPLPAGQVRFQLADAGVSWLFVSTLDQLQKVRQIRPKLPALRGVVLFDRAAPANDVVSWTAFLQKGRVTLTRCATELARREAELGPEDLATIMYTSGTTGDPKGVMLTHGNLLSNAWEAMHAAGQCSEGLILNWLPFSHIFARTVDHYGCLAGGTTLALATSAETLVENLSEVQPTQMASVPRFYEKVLAAVATSDPDETGKRLRDIFGPRIDWLSSGGAPLPRPIAEAYESAGVRLLAGYGLTESAPIISFNSKERYRMGTVGLPLKGVEVRIAPDGEILCRGPNVMKGYWNNPEATAEAIRDGWLHTGDLGTLDADGFLTVTGRKKELLVLSNGKKIVPSYLEGLMMGEPCIDQAVICGEGRHYLTALLVPHWQNVRRELEGQGEKLDSQPASALAGNPKVQALLRQHIDHALAQVASWEQVKRFAVLPEPLSVDGGELTVSLKLRRSVIWDKYKTEVEALYRE